MLEQPDEQLVVPAFSRNPVQTPRLEVERPADPYLAVGSRSAKGLLLSFAHPVEAHFGVGLEFGLLLEEGAGLLCAIESTSSSLAFFCSICSSEFLSGGTGRGLLQRKPRRWSARRSVSRLAAVARSLSSCRASSLQLQRSWRAQPSVGGGRVLFEQTLEALVRLLSEQRFRASSPAVVEGGFALPEEALGDGVDGGARAEKRSGDLGGRATIRGEQRDVHPEPSTGFRLALHPKDEVLAFFGGDDDTLHGRPSLWWLDGFGVFTMPQRTAACSIILCIYLVAMRCTHRLSPASGSARTCWAA